MPSFKTLLTTTLVASLIHSAIAVPTLPQDQPPTAVITERDDYVDGLRIAADWETPPLETRDLDLTKRGSNLGNLATCAKKQQPNWPHTQLTKAQSDACSGGIKPKGKRAKDVNAPTEQKSSDKKFNMESMCAKGQEILKYFLFNSDFKTEATKICNKALDYTEPQTLKKDTLIPKGLLWGAQLAGVRARRKIAATIWHTPNQKLNIVIAAVNLALDASPGTKAMAVNMCHDAVTHLSETCFTGISSGFISNGVHQSQKPGTVTFSDKDKKPLIKFDFSLVNP